MPWARTGHTYIGYLLGLLLVVQFFLAGWGIADLGHNADVLDAHRGVGSLMQLLGLILLILALLGRYRGPLLGMTIGLFVFLVLQSVWVHVDASVLRALHAVGALFIAMTVREIVGFKQQSPRASAADRAA
ncbi:MAG: hypothetical protein QOJ07_2701 [Thermoleophilaceae bacterium]|jgi:hypothetical protein|nr:hypothetical protein [Thermoleophilaceae bacterium]